MKSLIRIAAVVTGAMLFAATGATARTAKLPDTMLGMWCLDKQNTGNVYEFYERGDCGPGKTTTYLVISQEKFRGHEFECKIKRITKRDSRRGDRYDVAVRCWDEGHVGNDVFFVWDIDDGIMLTNKYQQSRYPEPDKGQGAPTRPRFDVALSVFIEHAPLANDVQQ
jgi:hypothetical protein